MEKVDPTFCDVPPCFDLGKLGDLAADVAIFGSPHGTPYQPGIRSHAASAPKAVREALGWFSIGREQFDFDSEQPLMGSAKIVDCGDVAGDLYDGAANRAAIKATGEAILSAGALPLLLGGDDSTPIPLIEAFAATGRPLTILQIDAHIDWREDIDGERFGYSSTMRRASEMDHVAAMVQVGARGPGSARRSDYEDAKAWGAKFHLAREVHERGVEAAIDDLPEGAEVFLSVDVDGLDPSLVPGVILPAFGGLGYQQMLRIIQGVAAKAKLVGAAFVEFVPERDPNGVGAKAISRLVANVIAVAFPEEAG